MLKINRSDSGSERVITLEGRLDTLTAGDLEKEIRGQLDGVEKLVFDMKDLEYISSAGLRVLIQAQKAMAGQGELKVLHINETVREIFEVTGFTEFLEIE